MAVFKGIIYHISMAACEGFLIFLMLFDAALAYFLAKFARYCDLQSPCIFCLRLDHFFGKLLGCHEKPRSYLNLFCGKHRAEVSCLVGCEAHGKLADVTEMCDECFVSVTRADGYRKPCFDRRPSSCGLCSCCETEWKPRGKLGKGRKVGAAVGRLGPGKVVVKPPLPRVVGPGPGRGRFRRRNLFKRVRGRVSGSSTPCGSRSVRNNARVKMEIDTLSDIGCVRFESDSECEVPVFSKDVRKDEFRFYSDSDSGSDSDSRIAGSKNVLRPRKKRGFLKDKTRPKQRSLVDDGHHNESTRIFPPPLTSKDSIGMHGPKELNNHSRDVFAPSVPEEKPSTSRDSIQDSIGNVEIRSRDVSVPSSLPHEKSTIQDSTGDVEIRSRDVFTPSLHQETSSTSTGSIQDSRNVVTDDDSKGRNGHNNNNNDERPSSSSSPSAGPVQDSKRDVPNFDGFNDHDSPSSSSSSGKSSDGFASPISTVSDIEGETALEKLKRQVDHDRERLHLLHVELEEERTHAAVAADEAMAMITRLQEEKAALHMEALQYLRMMDEQAEYDMEALDKANDLVAEKDKDIQDLEAELEYLRSRYDEDLGTGRFPKTPLGNGKTRFANPGFNSTTPRKGPVLDLQDEKRYILQCLSDLERKFNQVGKSNGNNNMRNTEMEEDFEDNGMQSKRKDSSVTLNGSKKVDVDMLENEISDLNERLEALEADRDFLEHACNTLQANGGLEFIQEISRHLQDLRKIRFDRRSQSVA